jgi:hypothetical protein
LKKNLRTKEQAEAAAAAAAAAAARKGAVAVAEEEEDINKKRQQQIITHRKTNTPTCDENAALVPQGPSPARQSVSAATSRWL